MPRRALVTGGAGFIGSHLVARLLSEGWQVQVLDNFSTGTWENLRFLQPDVAVIVGDIRDQASCSKACEGIDTVFHLAAIASVVGSIEQPALSHDVTLNGTVTMLAAARAASVRRFVFSSSAAVYGGSAAVPTDEDQPLDPQSPYATAKAAGEYYCRNFNALYGLETVILRYFNVFGPRQNVRSGYAAVIPSFIEAAILGRPPKIFGDGLQTRDFVYVENVATANLQAALADGVAGETFNIAGGEAITIIDLLKELERFTSAPLTPQFLPPRPGEIRHSCADISRARYQLGYEPNTSISSGLLRMLDSMRESRSTGDASPVSAISAA